MNSDSLNLFDTFFKFAKGQKENYLTEVFVYLLNLIKENDRNKLTEILNFLTQLDLSMDDLNNIKIDSQVGITNGIVDIQIKSDTCLVYIEVKVEHHFGSEQIPNYKNYLANQAQSKKNLVIIAKYSKNCYQNCSQSDNFFTWQQIANEFKKFKNSNNSERNFLINQFLSFLEKHIINISKLESNLSQSMNNFKNFLNLISNSVHILDSVSISNTFGFDYYGGFVGLYIRVSEPQKNNRKVSKYFVGIYFDYPNILVIQNHFHYKLQKDKEAQNPDIFLKGNKDIVWYRNFELDDEFFGKDAQGQLDSLAQFINEKYEEGNELLEFYKKTTDNSSVNPT